MYALSTKVSGLTPLKMDVCFVYKDVRAKLLRMANLRAFYIGYS